MFKFLRRKNLYMSNNFVNKTCLVDLKYYLSRDFNKAFIPQSDRLTDIFRISNMFFAQIVPIPDKEEALVTILRAHRIDTIYIIEGDKQALEDLRNINIKICMILKDSDSK